MATISATELSTLNPDYSRIAWFNMSAGDIGEAVLMIGFQVLSIQSFGNYVDGIVAFEGNNSDDPDEFYRINVRESGIDYITENILERDVSRVYRLRPRIANGTVSTSISVIILRKKI